MTARVLLAQKRLSEGRFAWWPSGTEPAHSLEHIEAQSLPAAGDPDTGAGQRGTIS